jgi:hypothetical protein
MADRPARLALPIAPLLLAALAVSMCQRPPAVSYARRIEAGRQADAANATWNRAHSDAP